MDAKKVVLLIVLIVAIAFAIIGVVFYRNTNSSSGEEMPDKHYITLEDMYCNIKESKRIVKLKMTVEMVNEDTYENLNEKQFLIRDEINKIIRNKNEEELQGRDGQLKLQNEIKNSLVELFDDESITNVYFDDLIIQ